jgi:hypothetical protein
MLKRFFKRLFCRHDYKCIYTRKINVGMNKQYIYQCSKCKKQKSYIL